MRSQEETLTWWSRRETAPLTAGAVSEDEQERTG